MSHTIDDEHNLIARYALKLAEQEKQSNIPNGNGSLSSSFRSVSSSNSSSLLSSPDFNQQQRLLDKLEASNRQIMEEITQLKFASSFDSPQGGTMYNELGILKKHKNELEDRMGKLQDGRKDLMEQLDKLMTLLKTRDNRLVSPSHRKYSASSLPKPSSSHPQTARKVPTQVSRTKRQFPELFDAADQVNEAMGQLVKQVTSPP